MGDLANKLMTESLFKVSNWYFGIFTMKCHAHLIDYLLTSQSNIIKLLDLEG